jgi:predicted F0F1-ATPase subunit
MISQDKKQAVSNIDVPKKSETPIASQTNPQKTIIAASLLAQVSTLAWNLVIPIVGGVLLGHYLDNRNKPGVTWTLSLLVLGVLIAFSNLYNLYIEHKHSDLNEDINNVTVRESNAEEK